MFPLHLQSQIRPTAPALIWQDTCYNFLELSTIVTQVSKQFPETDSPLRIGILGPTSDRYVITILAAMLRGLTILLLPNQWTISELHAAVLESELDLLLLDDERTPLIRSKPFPIQKNFNRYFETDCTDTRIDPDQYQQSKLLIFTSGSSGKPKRVVLSWNALETHAIRSQQHLQYSASDRWLVTLPLSHIGGISSFIKMMVTGLSVHLESGFNVKQVNSLLSLNSISRLSFVPTTLMKLLNDRNEEPLPDSIKSVIVGGGRSTRELLQKDSRFLASYGMSEAGSQITTVPPNSSDEIRFSAGIPLPGVSVTIRDHNGASVPSMTVGEIYIQTPALAEGYDLDPIGTTDRFVNGWFQTGDTGYLSDSGALFVLGRRSDRIVTGGENVDPREVEAAISKLPGVLDVAVFGVPDTVWGEIVVSVIVSEQSSEDFSLRTLLLNQIAGYKIPKKWVFVSEIPVLETGKTDYHSLISLF